MVFKDHPAYLLIGAMKSGTTSLFEDITRHSGIHSPTIKEPGDLCNERVLTDAGMRDYARVFAGVKPGQWIGEATPRYTRYPLIQGVPERARHVFGPSLRLIFIGRDPVERLRSHYRHEVQRGNLHCSLLQALEVDPALKAVSRYDDQLEQWLAVFPRNQLLVLDMQDYINEPQKVVHRVWTFLGLQPEEMDHGIIANVSAGKRAPRGLLRTVVRSRFYGLHVKKWLPKTWRASLRRVLVPRRAERFEDALPPSVEAALASEFDLATRKFRSMVEEDRVNQTHPLCDDTSARPS